MWVQMPSSETASGKPSGWEEYWLPIEYTEFLAMRQVVKDYIPTLPDHPASGLYRTVASRAVSDAGYDLSKYQGSDKILISSALGLPLKVADGDWRSGPVGSWKRVFDVTPPVQAASGSVQGEFLEALGSEWIDPGHRDGRIVRSDGTFVVLTGRNGRWAVCRTTKDGREVGRFRGYYKTPEAAMAAADTQRPMRERATRKDREEAQDRLMSGMQMAMTSASERDQVDAAIYQEMSKQFRRIEKFLGYDPLSWSLGG